MKKSGICLLLIIFASNLEAVRGGGSGRGGGRVSRSGGFGGGRSGSETASEETALDDAETVSIEEEA
jgi:hypothetical protein